MDDLKRRRNEGVDQSQRDSEAWPPYIPGGPADGPATPTGFLEDSDMRGKMMGLSSFPPGVSGTEPEIAGYDDQKAPTVQREVGRTHYRYGHAENGVYMAFVRELGQSLHFHYETGSRLRPQGFTIEKQDLAAFLRALGWTVEIPKVTDDNAE